jgi:hypothetical protein
MTGHVALPAGGKSAPRLSVARAQKDEQTMVQKYLFQGQSKLGSVQNRTKVETLSGPRTFTW